MSMKSKIALVRDWQTVKDKLEHYAWARKIIAKVKPDTDWWAANYKDDVNRVGGWGHNYFCDGCFTMLTFDRSKPEDHMCGSCGQIRRDEKANDAWNYMYRTNSC